MTWRLSLALALAGGVACDLGADNIGDLDSGEGGATEGTEASSTSQGSSSESEGTSGTTGGGGQLGGGVCQGALEDSYAAWETARDAAANTYSLTMTETMVIADFCGGDVYVACDTTTVLEVSGGEIVSRTFTAAPSSNDTAPEDCPAGYVEAGDALGSNINGYPLRTVEDVYQACCDLASMAGGYALDYEDYLPGDAVVFIGDDSLLQGCTVQYCDDCGCDGGAVHTVSSIAFGA